VLIAHSCKLLNRLFERWSPVSLANLGGHLSPMGWTKLRSVIDRMSRPNEGQGALENETLSGLVTSTAYARALRTRRLSKPAGSFWLSVAARNAEVVAGQREGFLRLCILKAEASADVCAIGPPAQLTVLCNAGGFSAQQIQLPSSRVDN
jgi:hypothetical protein